MNPVKMSAEAERALEGVNLAFGACSLGAALLQWITSPQEIGKESPLVIGAYLLSWIALPLLVVTSSVLLFTHPRRAALGFGAFLFSIAVLSQCSGVMR